MILYAKETILEQNKSPGGTLQESNQYVLYFTNCKMLEMFYDIQTSNGF